MNIAEHYTYRVQWSKDDNEYVATVAEFPSLSWLAASPSEAISGAISLVGDVIEDLKESSEPVPEPFSERAYSGRFVVRTSPETHRRLAVEAAEQNVSLNYLAGQRLVAV